MHYLLCNNRVADYARCALLILAVAATGVHGIPAGEGGEEIDRLHWLAGCWQREGAGRLTQEQWTEPLGNTMLGVSRTVSDGRTVGYEYLRIERSEGRLRLIAAPSGQRETAFDLVKLEETQVEFANPEHDFPQIVRYRLMPDGALLGQIEGTKDGRIRVVDFPMRPVSCPEAEEERTE